MKLEVEQKQEDKEEEKDERRRKAGQLNEMNDSVDETDRAEAVRNTHNLLGTESNFIFRVGRSALLPLNSIPHNYLIENI